MISNLFSRKVEVGLGLNKSIGRHANFLQRSSIEEAQTMLASQSMEAGEIHGISCPSKA